MGPPHGLVILLNGTSSAGKSSVARALQDALPGYPIHTGIDHVHERAPGRLHRVSDGSSNLDHDGFLWVHAGGGPELTELRVGPAARRVWAGMHAAAAALALAGNDVIVDDLLFDPGVRRGAAEALADLDALLVGVRCPLEVAEARERERDRTPGLARALAGAHDGCPYDVEVDSSVLSPEECASRIVRRLREGRPTAMRRLRAELAAAT